MVSKVDFKDVYDFYKPRRLKRIWVLVLNGSVGLEFVYSR